jgi:hypothetical protein
MIISMSYNSGHKKMPPGGAEMRHLTDGEPSGWNYEYKPRKVVNRLTLSSYIGRHALDMPTRKYEPHHADTMDIPDITDDEEPGPDPRYCSGGQYLTGLELSYKYPTLSRLTDPKTPKFAEVEIIPSELRAELEDFEAERSMFIFCPRRPKFSDLFHCSSWKGPKALDRALRHVRRYHGDFPEDYKEAVKKLDIGKKALFMLLCIPAAARPAVPDALSRWDFETRIAAVYAATYPDHPYEYLGMEKSPEDYSSTGSAMVSTDVTRLTESC